MNEVPFFLVKRSVPDRQPVDRQLSVQPCVSFRVDSPKDDVAANVRDHCVILTCVICSL